jgi:hypothetical protein
MWTVDGGMPFRAKVNGCCAICEEIILPGTITTPLRLPPVVDENGQTSSSLAGPPSPILW